MPNTTWLEDLHLHGFAVVRRVLSAQECSPLIAAFEQASDTASRNGSTFGARRALAIPSVRRWADGKGLELATAVLGSNARPVRGLLFDKTAEANWPVPWHQDLTIAVDERREVPGYGPWSIKAGVVHVW